MIIEYKNIRFKYSEVDYHHTDFVGQLNTYIPDYIWDKYKEYCTEDQLLDKIPYDEINEYDLDGDELPYSMYINKYSNRYEITSADVYICFLSWLLFQDKIQLKDNDYIECQYDNVSWLFHDIYHAENHVENFSTIFVQANDEYQTLHYGLLEGSKYETYSHEFLELLEELFKNRFSKSYGSKPYISLVDEYFKYEEEEELEVA